MGKVIDYYFAPISGYAYLGHQNLMALARDTGAQIRFRPVVIGKVFAASDTTPPFAQSAARKRYRIADQRRWADSYGLAITATPKFWPTDPVLACRAIVAAGRVGSDPDAASFACLKAVWAEDRNIADPDDLRTCLSEAGLPAADILQMATTPDIEAEVEQITQQAIAAGVFGSPTYVIKGALFWGQDRLEFLRAALTLEPA